MTDDTARARDVALLLNHAADTLLAGAEATVKLAQVATPAGCAARRRAIQDVIAAAHRVLDAASELLAAEVDQVGAAVGAAAGSGGGALEPPGVAGEQGRAARALWPRGSSSRARVRPGGAGGRVWVGSRRIDRLAVVGLDSSTLGVRGGSGDGDRLSCDATALERDVVVTEAPSGK